MSIFDMSEKFSRILNHGTGYRSSFENYLAFTAKHQPGLLARPCSGSRNALFFAIKEGRRDATHFLVCDHFSLFVSAENCDASRIEMKKTPLSLADITTLLTRLTRCNKLLPDSPPHPPMAA